MNADEWHAVRPGGDTVIALAMANVILSERSGAPSDANGLRNALGRYTPEMAADESGIGAEVIRRVAREFASGSPGLAVAGGIAGQHRGATELCAAVNLLNYVAGNVGQTVCFGADPDHGDGYGAVEALGQAMDAGQVSVLLVHEANPAFTLPRTFGFEARLKKVGFKVSTSMFLDETSAQCDLVLPNHHALERWDDARPRAGVYALLQPVMEPVFGAGAGAAGGGTMATGDLLLKVSQKAGGALARFNAPTFEEHLKNAWASFARTRRAADTDAFWRDALARGGVFDDVAPPLRGAPCRRLPGGLCPPRL